MAEGHQVSSDEAPKLDCKFVKSTIAINVEDIGWCFGLVNRKFNGKSSCSSGQWYLVSFESSEPAMTLLIDTELYWTPSEDTEDKDEPKTSGFWCAVEEVSSVSD